MHSQIHRYINHLQQAVGIVALHRVGCSVGQGLGLGGWWLDAWLVGGRDKHAEFVVFFSCGQQQVNKLRRPQRGDGERTRCDEDVLRTWYPVS